MTQTAHELLVRYPACGTFPLTRVTLVERFIRPVAGFKYRSTSLPGHLVHLVLAGKVRQEISGDLHELGAGELYWHYEDELATGEVVEAPWEFYSVNFLAPALKPPPFGSRRTRATQNTEGLFSALIDDWRNLTLLEAVRDFRVQSRLLMLLADIWPLFGDTSELPTTNLWWELETMIRADIERRHTLTELSVRCGRSIPTITRSCIDAVGMPPMKRVKQIRLSLAQGLLHHSTIPISEIAARIGYDRVHEFSRDYKKHYGLSPTDDRNKPYPYTRAYPSE